VTLFAVLLYLV